MTPIQVAISLTKLLNSGKVIFLRCEPEVLDFTAETVNASLVLCTSTEEISIPLAPKQLFAYMGLLNAAIFEDQDVIVIAWNIKNFISFVLSHTKALIDPKCHLIDLKPVEGFLGVLNGIPKTWHEATGRLKAVTTHISWSSAKNIYQKVHIPLILRVVPSMETHGLFDSEAKVSVYSHYEIEGQTNGRLCNHKVLRHCFLPHSMGPHERNVLRPRHIDEVFMYFDYRNMEIAMLQWLSKDDRLKQLLDLDEDLYKVVFKLISGDDCDSEKKRNLCKNFLIGVIYGQSARSLAENHNLVLQTAEAIVSKLKALFPIAFGWLRDIQENAGEAVCDVLGRLRFFDERQHRVRNFVVQSPASMVCLEKLICFYDHLRGQAHVVCHIHDGYIAVAPRKNIKVVASLAKEVLESESSLCPGLRIRCACKVGRKLAEMSELNG